MPTRRITMVLAVLLAALAAPRSAFAADTRCPGATLRPDHAQLPAFTRALVCLVNRQRARLSRPRLRRDRRLAWAARRQTLDMVRGNFFSHLAPGGGVGDRLRRAGYVPRDPSWMVGEVLSWGASWRSTPRAAVDAWLHSPPHRRALLEPRFREIGAGATIGTPGRAAGVTVAVELGRGG